MFPEFKPEKITEALAAFPPKLSALAEIFTAPEEMFEQQASAAGVPVPPGPAKMTVQFMQGIESMIFAVPFGAPSFGAPFGQIQTQEQTQSSEVSLGEAKTLEIKETPKRPRVNIDILEA